MLFFNTVARHGLLLTLLLAAGYAAAMPPDRMREELEAAMRLYYADRQAALEPMRILAEHGCAKAQIKLSGLYSHGDVEKKAQGFQWMRRAAENGNAQAQFYMGLAYEMGDYGLPSRSYDQARQWYLRAAEQGYPRAMNTLGALYYYGRGVERDLVQTYKWWALAAPRYPPPTDEPAYGIGDDNEMRNRMHWRLEQGVEPHMDASEINEAKRLAREWEEAHDRIRHMPGSSEKPLPIWLHAIEGGCDD